MQTKASRVANAAPSASIAELRSAVQGNGRFGSAPPKPPKPPKPRKPPKRDSDEERALKAEKLALAQHTTSLLEGGNSRKPYLRPGEREQRKGGGLIVQLMLVIAIAGGVALALDPSLVPAEWSATAKAFIGQYIDL